MEEEAGGDPLQPGDEETLGVTDPPRSSEVRYVSELEGPPEDIQLKEYANRIERLDTYKTWPKPKIDVNALVEAGMFYKGDEDRTECYYCGIPLKHWDIHDDPWIEHARFSQDCQFLHFHRGWAFVKAVLEFYDLSTVGIQIQRATYSVPRYGTSESYTPLTQSSSARSRPAPAPLPKRVIRRVGPGEIRSRLDMDNVKMLMALGYPRELIGQVIGERLQTEGDDFKYFGDLVRAVMNTAEMLGIQLHTAIPSLSSKTFSYDGSTFSPWPRLGIVDPAGPVIPPDAYGEDLYRAVQKAREENKALKEVMYCKRCRKKEVNVVLLNCGHVVLCEYCAKFVHICPRCHSHILLRLKVFIA